MIDVNLISSLGLAISSAAIGYAFRQSSRVTRLEESNTFQRNVSDERWELLLGMIDKLSNKLDRLVDNELFTRTAVCIDPLCPRNSRKS